MGRTNFTLCANEFIGNNSKYTNFIYKGTLPSPGLISRNYTSQITYEGCLKLCGSGVQYYSWDQISNTILTWTLPVLGITLLAPFESNAFWETVFTLSRWIGNPIASIASTLWNIKITGKCAMLVSCRKRVIGFATDPPQSLRGHTTECILGRPSCSVQGTARRAALRNEPICSDARFPLYSGLYESIYYTS